MMLVLIYLFLELLPWRLVTSGDWPQAKPASVGIYSSMRWGIGKVRNGIVGGWHT